MRMREIEGELASEWIALDPIYETPLYTFPINAQTSCKSSKSRRSDSLHRCGPHGLVPLPVHSFIAWGISTFLTSLSWVLTLADHFRASADRVAR
jgi:hypothetical protein